MKIQQTFERYEIKYLTDHQTKLKLLEAIRPYMVPDSFGRTCIRNIYYDTDNFRLIRTSLESPIYKEKLRVRSYKEVSGSEQVFVEIKKKYDHIVYKRRIEMSKNEADDYLSGRIEAPDPNQISREIDYFLSFYKSLEPRVFLSYDREAYVSEDASLRITFDDNILYRETDLDLGCDVYGTAFLPLSASLMEIKTGPGMPLWLSALLDRYELRKTSFSKYGNAYRDLQNNKRIITYPPQKESEVIRYA